jgi:hypothetical protein
METIYQTICDQAKNEAYRHDYPTRSYSWYNDDCSWNWGNESESEDDYTTYRKQFPVDVEFHRKCLASGVTRKVYDSDTVLQVKVDLLLKAMEENLAIPPNCYLFVIQQMKQHNGCSSMKTLKLLEQKYTCLKKKRNLRQRKHRFENEDSEDLFY